MVVKHSKNYAFYAIVDIDGEKAIKGINLKDMELSDFFTEVLYFSFNKNFAGDKLDKGKTTLKVLEAFRKQFFKKYKHKYSSIVEIRYCRMNSKRCPFKLNMSNFSYKKLNDDKIHFVKVNFV